MVFGLFFFFFLPCSHPWHCRNPAWVSWDRGLDFSTSRLRVHPPTLVSPRVSSKLRYGGARNLFALPISTCDPSLGGPPVPFRPCGQCATQKPSDLDPALVAGFFFSVFILFSARHRRQDGLVASGSEGGQAPSSALAHTPPLGVPPTWQSGDVPLLLVPTSAVPRRHACQPETQPPPNHGTRQDMARDTGNMTQPPAQYKRTSN